MRQIGSLPDQAAARRFRAWLLASDVATDIESEDGLWVIWVHDEDQVGSAKTQLEEFVAEPGADRYRLAEEAVEAQQRARPVKPKRVPDRPAAAGQPWMMTPWRRCRATMVLIGLSVLATALCVRGFDRDRGALEFKMAYEPVMDQLTIVDVEERADGVYVPTYNLSRAWLHIQHAVTRDDEYKPPDSGVGKIVRGQFWRLVTPIFLHFSILHILFNMLWLRMLGGEIEAKRGLCRFVGLVLLIAVVSNIGQYAATESPLFGGMSGVVYGTFGYLWMKQRFDPASGTSLPPSCVFWMLGWFVLCWTGMVGPIANWGHTFGLASGMLVGLLPTRSGRIRDHSA